MASETQKREAIAKMARDLRQNGYSSKAAEQRAREVAIRNDRKQTNKNK